MANQGTPDSPLTGVFDFRIVITGQIVAPNKEQVVDWMTAHFNMSLMAGQHVKDVQYGVGEAAPHDPANILYKGRPT